MWPRRRCSAPASSAIARCARPARPSALGSTASGAAAHIVAQVARHQGRRVFAFARRGDRPVQDLARALGAEWAWASEDPPPEPLDAAILFAPVGALVPLALAAVVPGGTVVAAGIHMSDIPGFPYRLLWGERRDGSPARLCLCPRSPSSAAGSCGHRRGRRCGRARGSRHRRDARLLRSRRCARESAARALRCVVPAPSSPGPGL